MSLNDKFAEIGNKLSAMGVGPVKDPQLTVNEIIEIGGEYLETLEIEVLEELLQRIASYNIFLKSQRGAIEAQIAIVEPELRRLLYLHTQTITTKFISRDEKEALIISQNPQIATLSDRLNKLKAQAVRIRDLPLAIDKKLDLIRFKYQRKLGERNDCKFSTN